MKGFALIVGWICVVSAGFSLRFTDLASRPFHADEATGARITAYRMEGNGGKFDPRHYHGPLLGDLAIPLCRWSGENSWQEMKKSTLRELPAAAGWLLLWVPLLWRKRFGDVAMLAAAAFLATSPLLVYYSRMFIHEPLLVLFGVLALVALVSKPGLGIPGIFVGLMFSTKETAAISVIAWTGAAGILCWENRKICPVREIFARWRDFRTPVVASLVTAACVATAFYTDGFRYPQGAVDAIQTFFVYETVGGHEKPAGYYFQQFVLPFQSGGVWWFGVPLCLLAFVAYALTFLPSEQDWKLRARIRFIAYAGAGHVLIYSCISYKTPWLACLPWAYLALMAGCAFVEFPRRRWSTQAGLVALGAFCVFSQYHQAWMATGRLASDSRNPFAYVPTRGDIERMEGWLKELAQTNPEIERELIGVVGVNYWPLPWYLRWHEKVGYWKSPPGQMAEFPLVFAMPEVADEVQKILQNTHTLAPRGLRDGVPVALWVKNDVWKRWMNTITP